MARSEFSPLVTACGSGHVRTLEELQLLMAIIQSDDRWWDAAGAAEEFGMTVVAARASLDYFAARNLLDIRITDDVRYQFRPGTPALRDAAKAAADAYRKRPIGVAQLVTGPSGRNVTDFADAFRIRRDDDDR